MGYFSNGTEGLDYQERYCSRCIHDINKSCPVWNAHLLFNDDECNNDKSVLHMLIPRNELSNGQCEMFVDKTLLSPLGREKFASQQSEPTNA